MAGNALLVDQQQQRIAVAIEAHLDETLDLAGAFALAPERLPRPRPIADLSGFQGANWPAEEALSREDALKLFTAWPAHASFREDDLGTIAVGMRADFTVFSADIMTIPEAEILTVEAWMTVVDGEVVYESPDSFHHGE